MIDLAFRQEIEAVKNALSEGRDGTVNPPLRLQDHYHPTSFLSLKAFRPCPLLLWSRLPCPPHSKHTKRPYVPTPWSSWLGRRSWRCCDLRCSSSTTYSPLTLHTLSSLKEAKWREQVSFTVRLASNRSRLNSKTFIDSSGCFARKSEIRTRS